MRIRWYGQSAFLLRGERSVFIDPFGAMEGLAARGMQFDYPPIEGADADLVLVTHEHGDHNAVEVVGGSPLILRSTAGTSAYTSGRATLSSALVRARSWKPWKTKPKAESRSAES